ncbi:ComEC/Rec2 family competence protein [Phenylobacterium sp.]|uniref:ComEC/Rec2 family competence protein n=1 Tax=Phenylobacterium sp. TaxID=1871053 RepID=UPI002FC66CBA
MELETAARGRARGLSTSFRAGPSFRRIAAWVGEQARAQTDRWTLWTPVAFGIGAAIYLALPGEPLTLMAFLALAVAAGLVAATRWSPRRAFTVGLVLLAFGSAGFAAAKLRTQAVRAPIAPAGTGVVSIEAFVVDVASPGRGGPRLLLAPIRVSRLEPEATPIRVRVTLKDDDVLPAPGTAIRLRGMLNAPPPPASPGSYDFARDAFFDGIGGVGFALTPVREIEVAQRPPWRLAWEMRINAARWSLARQIVDEMGVESGGLAAAMVTGHEAFIPKEQVEALRAAGLAHIISISGLHMAIVGGFTFALVRLLIAAWPWAALRISSKKTAALAGFAAVLAYLVLSGAPSPAERAAITAAAAFGAILVDRQAISLRTLAIAALGILILHPEAVSEPGFQMSFAATAALVALAEAWPRVPKEINTPWPIRLVQAIGVWTAASLGASFVAGLATGPFAMQHFNRVATFGLVANLLVAPISSFLMMPALALGAVLAPLGLGAVPLAAADLAIDTMNRIAATAAGLPGAQLTVASAPGWTLAAAFLGILWLCLCRGPLRWLGLPFALAVAIYPRPSAPDAWIAADGSTVAVRAGDEAVLFRPDAKLFAAELWARRRGLRVPEGGLAARDRSYDCDRWSCAPRLGAETPRIAAIMTRRPSTIERKLPLFCQWAEVVVVRGEAPPCPGALTLTQADFARGGSAELYREPDGWRIVWAQDLRGQRPWTLSGSGG